MKHIALILVLSMLLVVTGCHNNIDAPVTSERSGTIESTNSLPDSSDYPETVPQSQQPDTEDTSVEGNTDTEPYTNDTSTSANIDEPIEDSLPEQTHVGVWYMDSDKQQYIRITRMKSDMIVFFAKPYSDTLHFPICAVKQGDEYVFGKDVSPENTERLAEHNISGKLSLKDDIVKLVYNPSDLWDTEVVQQFTVKNEVDKLDLNSETLPSNISEKLHGIIEKLNDVGWKDIEVIPHEPNSRIRWNVILDAYDLPTNAELYCVTARSRLTYINVYVIFEGGVQIDEVVYYVSLSGRVMEGALLDNFMKRYNYEIIVPADNENLHYYFESY